MEQDEFDLKIKQDFISEALEMLGWVEDQFLIFEQNPQDSKVVDEIFRMAHTVKGSAMTCGFLRLGEFAHVMETLLVKIREGKHQPDSETVDVLLRANDTLRNYIELLKKDFDAVLDTESMKEDLQYFIGEPVAASTTGVATFGFFDDDEGESEVEPPQASTAASADSASWLPPAMQAQKSDLPSVYEDDSETTPLDEVSFLSLKAYLNLSHDSSPEGVQACLRTLEEALAHLNFIRGHPSS